MSRLSLLWIDLDARAVSGASIEDVFATQATLSVFPRDRFRLTRPLRRTEIDRVRRNGMRVVIRHRHGLSRLTRAVSLRIVAFEEPRLIAWADQARVAYRFDPATSITGTEVVPSVRAPRILRGALRQQHVADMVAAVCRSAGDRRSRTPTWLDAVAKT
jgi:hypothetical protein